MRIVDHAAFSPGHCCVSGEAEGPFLDLECVVSGIDGRVYLRPGVVQLAAETCGLFDKYKREYDANAIVIKELREEVANLNRELDAYALIEKRAPVKRGRPKKAEVEA